MSTVDQKKWTVAYSWLNNGVVAKYDKGENDNPVTMVRLCIHGQHTIEHAMKFLCQAIGLGVVPGCCHVHGVADSENFVKRV